MRYIICITLLIPTLIFAATTATPIAEVVKIRGEVTQLSPGAHMARVVSVGDKFLEDTSVLTGPKSFIKIKFIDNSELVMGPESKVVISEMKKDSVGIISLLKGRIRTEVEKDSKSVGNKLFIKTRTAALGVRGTDFQTIYNPDNKMTSLLTYKGSVAMVKVDEATYKRLEEAPAKVVVRDDATKVPEIKKIEAKKIDEVSELNKVLKSKDAVIVPPGQNSFSSDSLKKTSLPVKISPVQLEALYKNEDFQEKAAANLNLKSAAASDLKSNLQVARQVAPAEGLYNEKTGDFAPKSGGFIDLNTGLYVAPTNDAKLDPKSGVYVASKIGEVDADTGQYVAPKGLILDAKKGFVLAEGEGDSKVEKKPELLALREDLNQSIARDIVVGGEEGPVEVFNISEKFIRDRISFSIWGMQQNLTSNKNSNSAPFIELDSNSSTRFKLDWQMASNNRFAPLIGIDYSMVKFESAANKGVTTTSDKLLGLSYGLQYALNKTYNVYIKYGLHQDHYLDQTQLTWPHTYTLRRVVTSRITLGGNAEFWRGKKWSLDANAAGLFTFRKRINNLIINEGNGFILEVLPKYRFSERKWLGLGLQIEKQFQRVVGTVGINRHDRNSGGPELKFISEF